MENLSQQPIHALQISSSDIDLGEVTRILEKQNSTLLPSFISELYSSLLILEQWAWQLLSGDIQQWIDEANYLKFFQTLAVFNKNLIFFYDDIEASTKALLLIPETIEGIHRIFGRLSQLDDDNHIFIHLVSLWLDNLSYFIRENPEFETSITISSMNRDIARKYIMTDQYKYYLTQLHEVPLAEAMFTTKQLFYIKTCSLALSSYLFAKAQDFIYTAEQIIRQLGVDYVQNLIQHTYTMESWSPELLSCMTSLCALFASCCWWGGKKSTAAKVIFPTETQSCECIDVLIRILSYKPFHQCITPQLSNDQTILLDTTLFSMINIAENQDFIWFLRSKTSLSDILLTIAEASPSEKISLCVNGILTEILSDQRLKELEISDNVIIFFFDMLEQAWHHPSKKFKQIPIYYLLKAFVSFSKIDAIQQKTADTNKVLLLIEMADQCPMVFDILWALSFNPDIQQQLRSNTAFMAKLTHLPRKCDNESIRKTAHGILWNLESTHEDHEDRKEESDEKVFDIMISYSHKDEVICRRIYDELIRVGYRVWIDFDQMHGNVMDAMAYGIEQSKTILICMSEQYRRSNYCRAEAHYAFRRQLHIVPVLLHEHYKPDCWLLFLVGHLLYVNFGKHEFTKAVQMLIKEIQAMDTDKAHAVATEPDGSSVAALAILPVSISPTSSTPLKLSENILDWTNTHVHDWLIAHKLVEMSRLLSNCDGRSLVYLHDFIKNGETQEVLSLLNHDSLRLTNINLSLVELSSFQSLMDRQRNLVGSTDPAQQINIENNKTRKSTKIDRKKKHSLNCCRMM